MSEERVVRERAKAFYPLFERKAELQQHTHYCPGCGHGIVHKMIAAAIDQLGIQNRTIVISPVGCSVFAYHYLDVGNIQAAHGRAPAVATAVKRSRTDSIVLSYQGDGDLSAIGSAEILHAANRGENITVVFMNNAIYGMTGGQMAPTTLLGQSSTTSPCGRNPLNEGYPLHVSELLATLEAPVYIERVALGDNKQVAGANRAIQKALSNQVKRLGFSLVEVLSPCPTIWKKNPVDAQRWIREEMTKTYPLGVYRDKTKEATPRPEQLTPPAVERIPELLGLVDDGKEFAPHHDHTAQNVDLEIKVAGFGGQGVLLLGEMLAEAGLSAGYDVSWLPSYGPEMRSGTSNCNVRLSTGAVDSPLVSRPDILIAMNEPSLHKFYGAIRSGGWVIYNGERLPDECTRGDIRVIARPFDLLANGLGETRAANMVMLGALLEATDVLTEENIDDVLGVMVKSPKWLEIDRKAIALGRHFVREAVEA
jgi:2-oxoisovalerate ferredoxin oxidoreductase beta subunit